MLENGMLDKYYKLDKKIFDSHLFILSYRSKTMYILNSQKTLFTKMNNIYIERAEDYYKVDKYGVKQYIYYLYNDKYRIGFFNSLEKAKEMLYKIKIAYESPLTYNDYTVIEIKDDYDEIYKEF